MFLNTKSGPQTGARMRRRFLRCLNPLQVTPEPRLWMCCMRAAQNLLLRPVARRADSGAAHLPEPSSCAETHGQPMLPDGPGEYLENGHADLPLVHIQLAGAGR